MNNYAIDLRGSSIQEREMVLTVLHQHKSVGLHEKNFLKIGYEYDYYILSATGNYWYGGSYQSLRTKITIGDFVKKFGKEKTINIDTIYNLF